MGPKRPALKATGSSATGAGPKKKARVSTEKRVSLSEQINHLATEDDETIFQMLAELDGDIDMSIGFRWSSLSTQQRQDRHLRLYQDFVRVILKIPKESTDTEEAIDRAREAIDRACFPDDHETFFKLLKRFLMFAFRNAKSRDPEANLIDYPSICQYRDSVLFWAPRKYSERGIEAPGRTKIFNAATLVLRFTFSKHGGEGAKKRRNRGSKVSLGLEEIRQLLDFESSTGWCIEASEQHQLIWCILRQAAIRPGAIGSSKVNPAFLQWKHIRFQNTNVPGKFIVHVSFQNLKTNADDPQRALQQHGNRTLECYFDSPNEDNIIFSIPHRMLAMAIRRKLVVDISSLDALFASKSANILVS